MVQLAVQLILLQAPRHDFAILQHDVVGDSYQSEFQESLVGKQVSVAYVGPLDGVALQVSFTVGLIAVYTDTHQFEFSLRATLALLEFTQEVHAVEDRG